MATYLITNPRRKNGVLNRLIAKHLGSSKSGSATKMGRRSKAHREAIREFKRDAKKLAAFKRAHKPELADAQKRRKSATKASKADKSKHFLVQKAGYTVKAGKLVRPVRPNSTSMRKPMRKLRRRKNAVAQIVRSNRRSRRSRKARARRANPGLVRILQNRKRRAGRRKARRSMKRNVAFLVPNKRRKHAKRHRRSMRRNRSKFLRNTGLKAMLAPAKSLLKSEFALASLGGAAAVGAAHYFVAPYVSDLLESAAGKVQGLPVVGEYASKGLSFAGQYLSYTATGAAAGAALALIGVAAKRGKLGVQLGALAASSGIVMDVVSGLSKRASGDMGALYESFPPPASYGALGSEAVDYGAIAERMYGDAQMADAAACGADFSPDEGQALIAGPAAVLSVAGAPSVSQGHRVAAQGPYSRFAGQKMHRWGWLVKAVGFERARKIAMMEPSQRLKVIAQLRQQAMAAVDSAGYGAVAEVVRSLPNYGAIAEVEGFGSLGATGASAYGASEIIIGGGY